MMREGLWPMGKEGVEKKFNFRSGGKVVRPTSSHKDYNSFSSDSPTLKLPKIRRNKGNSDEDDKSRGIYPGGENDSNKKRKRRITFKLGDGSEPGSSGPSGVSLDGDGDDLHRGSGRRSKDRLGGGQIGGEHGGSEGGALDGGKTRGGRRHRGAGKELEGGGENGSDKQSKDGGRFKSRRRGQGQRSGGTDDESDGSGLLDGQGSGGSLQHKDKGRLPKETSSINRAGSIGQKGGESIQSGTQSSNYGNLKNGDLNSGNNSNHDGKGGASGDGKNGFEIVSSANDGATGGVKSGRNIGGDSEGSGTGMGHGKSTDRSNRNTDSVSQTSLHSSSQVSRAGSKGSGSRRGSLGKSDHGKNVRKGVGYMRAVSPTSSEWGDPHHGRSYISSTATSRTGSTSNLLRDVDRDDGDEESSSKSLPTVVPEIKKQQPLMDFSDLMDGFRLTRAWTFSYHNKLY